MRPLKFDVDCVMIIIALTMITSISKFRYTLRIVNEVDFFIFLFLFLSDANKLKDLVI
jgi:hypothetical protein